MTSWQQESFAYFFDPAIVSVSDYRRRNSDELWWLESGGTHRFAHSKWLRLCHSNSCANCLPPTLLSWQDSRFKPHQRGQNYSKEVTGSCTTWSINCYWLRLIDLLSLNRTLGYSIRLSLSSSIRYSFYLFRCLSSSFIAFGLTCLDPKRNLFFASLPSCS